MSKWEKRSERDYRLDAGALMLLVEDRPEFGCGWCWQVKGVNVLCDVDTAWIGGGEPSAAAAMTLAEDWARRFSLRILTALGLIGAHCGGSAPERAYALPARLPEFSARDARCAQSGA